MKQLIFLPFILLALVSCKKKYNCHCSTNVYYNFAQYSYPAKTTSMSQKMTEKQAKAVCANEAADIDATYMNYITNNGNYSSNGFTSHTLCTLE